MLAASWHDPEDYLLYEIALALRADVLITRNQPDFPQGLVPVMNCDEFFQWMRDTHGLDYGEIEF